MVKFVKFAFSELGQLVYRSNGRLVDKPYTYVGKTVYDENGRKIGSIGKPSKSEQARINKAESNRIARNEETLSKAKPRVLTPAESKIMEPGLFFGTKPGKTRPIKPEPIKPGRSADVPLTVIPETVPDNFIEYELDIDVFKEPENRFSIEDINPEYPNLSLDALSDVFDAVDMAYRSGVTLSRDERNLINFGKRLTNLLNGGFITKEEAENWLDRMRRAVSNEEKSDIWQDLKEDSRMLGYIDSD